MKCAYIIAASVICAFCVRARTQTSAARGLPPRNSCMPPAPTSSPSNSLRQPIGRRQRSLKGKKRSLISAFRHGRYRKVASMETDELREAIERLHGGSATLAQSVSVRETFDGKPVWEGVVHVFDLTGHPTAARVYAWSSPIEGGTKRRFFAVLHTERIGSAVE